MQIRWLANQTQGIARCAILGSLALLASCAASLPATVSDKRPSGNAGITLRDISADTWVFEKTSDPMTGASGYSSSIWSATTVQLPYPYQGDQKLTLTVGLSPRGGSYAALAIPRGQFSCHNCDVRVRFDGSSPVLFTGKSSLEVSGVLHLVGANRFIEQLRTASKVTIEAPFFNSPRKAVEFKSAGFPW